MDEEQGDHVCGEDRVTELLFFMSSFPNSTGAIISGGTFIDVGRDQINMFGHTKGTK